MDYPVLNRDVSLCGVRAVCRYLAPELHGFVQQLAVTRKEGLGHLAVCME